MVQIKLGWQVGGDKKPPFEKTMAWAKSINVQTLELGSWPHDRYCNVDRILAGNKAEVLDPVKKNGIEIATLGYCVNHLHPKEKIRNEHNQHMKKVIQAAQALEVPIVTCFIGNCSGDIYDNLTAFNTYYIPLLEFARDHGVKLAVENCQAGGLNLGSNPSVWEKLFFDTAKSFDNFGLTFDPSHLAWQAMDYYGALDSFVKRGKVFCLHAKDTQFNRKDTNKWWWFTIPGRGVINWTKIMQILKLNNFSGVVQIEHEDHEFQGKKYQEGVALGIINLTKALNSA